MTNFKNISKIAFVYIGTVMGAGFASGQEMLVFFASFGKDGIYGLILAGFMFFLIGWMVLQLILAFECTSYKEFICIITGKKIGIFFGVELLHLRKVLKAIFLCQLNGMQMIL